MDESGEVQVECLMQRREIQAKDAKFGGVTVMPWLKKKVQAETSGKSRRLRASKAMS